MAGRSRQGGKVADELDWDTRGRVCREALDFVRFLVGVWEGEGDSQGAAVTARLVVQDRFEGTFLHQEETLRDDSGAVVHDDAAFVRWDPDGELVRVTHYMARGWVSEQLVRPLRGEPGCLWYAGPFAPKVEFRPRGADRLDVIVRLPEQPEPDTTLRYRRVSGPPAPRG